MAFTNFALHIKVLLKVFKNHYFAKAFLCISLIQRLALWPHLRTSNSLRLCSNITNTKTNKLVDSRALQIAPSCQPDDLKHYTYELKHSIVTKNTLFGHKETQNTSFYGQKYHNLRARRT